MDEAEERAVRMGQRPHEPSGLVRDVEISPDFEAVKALEDETQRAGELSTRTLPA